MASKGKNYVQHCNSIGNWKYAFTCVSLSSLSARVQRTRGQNTKNKLKLKRFYAIEALHNTINIKFKCKKYSYWRFVVLSGLASIAVIFLENTTAASAPSRSLREQDRNNNRKQNWSACAIFSFQFSWLRGYRPICAFQLLLKLSNIFYVCDTLSSFIGIL